jgi:hypothetical protein
VIPTETEPQWKVCSACQYKLPAADFKKNAASKDGLYTYCRSCEKTRRLEPDAVDLSDMGGVMKTLKPAGIPAHVLNGVKIPIDAKQKSPGVWVWTTPKNWRVVVVHYSADPRFRPGTPEGDAWIKKEKEKSSTRDWNREREIDFTISEGEPFFPTFNRDMHVKALKYDPSLPIIRGWDFGRGHPSCVWAQKTKKNRIHVLRSIIETQRTIWDFAPYVIAETQMRYPGAEIIDCGDPAGAQETDKGATTQILLVEFHINLHYRWSSNEEGWKMMERSLIVREDGDPALAIDYRDNEDLIDGFAGGYKLDVTATGKDTEGRLKNSAKKDGWFEHVMDALRYIYIHCFKIDGKAASALQASTLHMTNAEIQKKKLDDDGGDEFFS